MSSAEVRNRQAEGIAARNRSDEMRAAVSTYPRTAKQRTVAAATLAATREARTKAHDLLSPDGIEHRNIRNLPDFCQERGLDPSTMYAVVRGKWKQHTGWRAL
jgi:hypothetical protein